MMSPNAAELQQFDENRATRQQIPNVKEALELAEQHEEDTNVRVYQIREVTNAQKEMTIVEHKMFEETLARHISVLAETTGPNVPSKFSESFAIHGEQVARAFQPFDGKPRQQIVWVIALALKASGSDVLKSEMLEGLLTKSAITRDLALRGGNKKQLFVELIQGVVRATGLLLQRFTCETAVTESFNSFMISAIVDFATKHELEAPAQTAKILASETVADLGAAIAELDSRELAAPATSEDYNKKLRDRDDQVMGEEEAAAEIAADKLDAKTKAKLAKTKAKLAAKAEAKTVVDIDLTTDPEAATKKAKVTVSHPKPPLANSTPTKKAKRAHRRSPSPSAEPVLTQAQKEAAIALGNTIVKLMEQRDNKTLVSKPACQRLHRLAKEIVKENDVLPPHLVSLMALKGKFNKPFADTLYALIRKVGGHHVSLSERVAMAVTAPAKWQPHLTRMTNTGVTEWYKQFCLYMSETAREHMFALLHPEFVDAALVAKKAFEAKSTFSFGAPTED